MLLSRLFFIYIGSTTLYDKMILMYIKKWLWNILRCLMGEENNKSCVLTENGTWNLSNMKDYTTTFRSCWIKRTWRGAAHSS
jgi:hypothetical protein